MNRARIALTLIAVPSAAVGLQATFAPRSFYDDFPLGRGWIPIEGGAFDEHLVRDVGLLYLALVVVTVWTVVSSMDPRPVAVAWLLQGVGHLVVHLRELDALDGADAVALVGSLAAVPALALVALLAARKRVGPAG
jgi:hypothetical protein